MKLDQKNCKMIIKEVYNHDYIIISDVIYHKL